jgi:hypothetical protein
MPPSARTRSPTASLPAPLEVSGRPRSRSGAQRRRGSPGIPELSDPVGSIEVGEHEDVEQLCAGAGPRVSRRSRSRRSVGSHRQETIRSGVILALPKRLPALTCAARPPSAASRRSSLRGHSYLVNVQFRCLGLWSPHPPASLVVQLYWWGDSSQLTCQEWLPAVHVQRLRM